MMATLRKYLIAGLLVWLPLAATFFIIRLLIELLDKTILLLPLEWQPQHLLGFSIPGMGFVFAFLVLFITGMLAANLFGRKLVEGWESLLGRIPVVRNIYQGVKQIASSLLTSSNQAFRKVVMLEYPRKGIWSLGFLTNESIKLTDSSSEIERIAVFIPTTPNPTSGFIIMADRNDVKELEITVEEGFKFIISLGVVVPDETIRQKLLENH